MRRQFYILLCSAFIFFVLGLNAQDNSRVYSFDNAAYLKTATSQGLQRAQLDQNHFVIHKEIKNTSFETREAYQFTLQVEGEWNALAIGNGSDFFELVYSFMLGENPYEVSLPEGHYDISISGYTDDFQPAFISFEQILINEDTELTARMADAVHIIDVNPVGVDNNSLKDLPIVDLELTYYLFMHPSIGMTFGSSISAWETGFPQDCQLYVNDMGARNSLFATVDCYTSDGDSYFIAMPMIEDGVTGDILLENSNDEIAHYTQKFNISKELTEDSYSNIGTLIAFYDFEGEHGWSFSSSWVYTRVHDRENPYSLYTNVAYNETPQTGDISFFICPIFYEFFDIYGNTDYTGMVTSFPIAVNKEKEIVKEFYGLFSDFTFVNAGDIVEMLANNPLSRPYRWEEFYHAGYRTPHLYYQARNFNPDANPYSQTILGGGLVFLGEFNEQKYNHGDVLVSVTGDGVPIFNDSIFLFNTTNLDATFSQYRIEVINDQIVAYGKNMINRTAIDFDMTNADANPPALTMLRVIDQEKVSMSVMQPETARLEITAGDFTLNFEEYSIEYKGKPDMEVSWSAEGETFYPLVVEEDASKFQSSYGNFFTVDLSSLKEVNLGIAWITIKIVLTDEAGNKVEQLLEPLFQYGAPVGIDDIVTEETKHVAYPNPFNGYVTVALDKPLSGETYFEIYDISGRIIHQQKLQCSQTASFTWNGSHVKEGVYFYGIYNKEGVIKGKIIKQ